MEKRTTAEGNQIKLAVPWSDGASNTANYGPIADSSWPENQSTSEVELARMAAEQAAATERRVFIEQRSALHATYVKETAKTTRAGYYTAAGMLSVGLIVPVIAPAGREQVSYFVAL